MKVIIGLADSLWLMVCSTASRWELMLPKLVKPIKTPVCVSNTRTLGHASHQDCCKAYGSLYVVGVILKCSLGW